MVPNRTSWPLMGSFPVLPVAAVPAQACLGNFLPFPFGPFGQLALWPFSFAFYLCAQWLHGFCVLFLCYHNGLVFRYYAVFIVMDRDGLLACFFGRAYVDRWFGFDILGLYFGRLQGTWII